MANATASRAGKVRVPHAQGACVFAQEQPRLSAAFRVEHPFLESKSRKTGDIAEAELAQGRR